MSATRILNEGATGQNLDGEHARLASSLVERGEDPPGRGEGATRVQHAVVVHDDDAAPLPRVVHRVTVQHLVTAQIEQSDGLRLSCLDKVASFELCP